MLNPNSELTPKMADNWTVDISGQAKKAKKNLSKSAIIAFYVLLKELKTMGPYRIDWPNYTKMKNKTEDYHCHIEKGKPTYIVCWKITNKKEKAIEVYYAGTHEKAPY